jgi:hypothetical protein
MFPAHDSRHTLMTRRAGSQSFLRLCAGLLLCLALAACGDTCFTITGIFPNATSTTNPPTCKLGDGNGTITVGINSVSASPAAPMAPNLRHIFVSVRGIEANPSALAAQDSPDWQELTPRLQSGPIQIDLMATSVSGASCAPRLIRKTIVHADVYRQVRLRLISDHPPAGDPLPQLNECNGLGFNCVVDTKGQKHALALENGAPDVLIASERITGGFFNVLPDTETRLSIAFDPYSSLAAAAGDAVRIVPVFFVDSNAECDSFSSSP